MSRSIFGRFEVESCKMVYMGITPCVEVCEDDEAEFYSVYTRTKEGFAICIFDLDNRKDAEEYVERLNKEDQKS